MLRDVIAREEIRNVTFIENLAVFIADNIGKLISVRNITNTMKSHGEKVSEMLTSTYLRYLCGAFIIPCSVTTSTAGASSSRTTSSISPTTACATCSADSTCAAASRR